MEKELVHQMKNHEDDEVRISVDRYQDKEYVDLRIFFKEKKGGEFKPTKKGLKLPAELIPGLVKGLGKAQEALSASKV